MSDFYGSREDADAYHTARGNAAWAGANEAKEAALLRASAWLDGAYRDRFPGSKAGGRAQIREWPRGDATDTAGDAIEDDEVPIEILHATFEAALREIASPGSLAPDYTLSSTVKSERVGSISVEYRDAITPGAFKPTLPLIEGILSSLIGTSGPVLFGASSRAY